MNPAPTSQVRAGKPFRRFPLELFRALRSGLRPHTRFFRVAAYRKGRYAWTETALVPLPLSPPLRALVPPRLL